MLYKLYLKCNTCGRQSGVKEYDATEERIKQIIKIANRALMLPQYLVCPQCLGIHTVKIMLVTIK